MTKNKMKEKRGLLVHPYFFALFPILLLLSDNVTRFVPADAAGPILLSLAGAVLLLAIAKPVMKDAVKAAIAASFLLFMFYSFGHVYILLAHKIVWGFDIGRRLYLFVAWTIIIMGGFWLLRRTERYLADLSRFLNVAGAILILLPLVSISVFQARKSAALSQDSRSGPRPTRAFSLPGRSGKGRSLVESFG